MLLVAFYWQQPIDPFIVVVKAVISIIDSDDFKISSSEAKKCIETASQSYLHLLPNWNFLGMSMAVIVKPAVHINA